MQADNDGRLEISGECICICRDGVPKMSFTMKNTTDAEIRPNFSFYVNYFGIVVQLEPRKSIPFNVTLGPKQSQDLTLVLHRGIGVSWVKGPINELFCRVLHSGVFYDFKIIFPMCILPFPNGRIYPPLYCTTWTDFSKNNEYEKNFFMKYAGDINDLLSKMEKHDVFIISKGFGETESTSNVYHSLKLQDDQWFLTRMKVTRGDSTIFVTVRSLSPLIGFIEQIFKHIISCSWIRDLKIVVSFFFLQSL